jgi:hypothetical protein
VLEVAHEKGEELYRLILYTKQVWRLSAGGSKIELCMQMFENSEDVCNSMETLSLIFSFLTPFLPHFYPFHIYIRLEIIKLTYILYKVLIHIFGEATISKLDLPVV